MHLYWIGARQWDISKNDMFTGSITRYGEDIDNNRSFCNDTQTSQFKDFIKNNIDNILKEDDDAHFLFANELNAYNYSHHVFKRSICVNKLSILESLNDKFFTRNFFSDCVNTPSSIVISAASCLDYNFVCSIFNNKFSTFVLQDAKSAGGQETYFLTPDCSLAISPKAPYVLVTPYYDNSLSINVHVLMGERTFKIMPPSLQVTIEKFKYSGSDFIAYQNLDASLKSKIINYTQKIAQKVQVIGGKGIFGIDFLVTENNVLFLECNYRYQGSSFLLNMGLQDAGMPSLFKCRYNSFYGDIDYIPDDIYDIKIAYSSFRRTEMNTQIALPKPTRIIAPNNEPSNSTDRYVQYEIFNTSIL